VALNNCLRFFLAAIPDSGWWEMGCDGRNILSQITIIVHACRSTMSLLVNYLATPL